MGSVISETTGDPLRWFVGNGWCYFIELKGLGYFLAKQGNNSVDIKIKFNDD